MGTLIASSIIDSDDMELVAAIDPTGGMVGDIDVLPPERLGNALKNSDTDVLVDFTTADAACDNAVLAAETGVNLVVGTTGITDEQMGRIHDAIEGNVAAVVAPNFATGVNVLLATTRRMAEMLPGYDMEIIEAHHGFKLDSPSGTALALHGELTEGSGKKLPVKHGRSGLEKRDDEVGIHSIRAGDIVGEHTVLFAGSGERLELTHRASSRQAFVDGALGAIRWLRGKSPGLYSMTDVLGLR
jgi:4-hydroxy-tetrahydrodipicolinate reductase